MKRVVTPAAAIVTVAVLSIVGTGLIINDAFAQTTNGEIKIAFLSDFEHVGIFNYAVSEFNSEQTAITSSNYHITSKVVSVPIGNVTIINTIKELESEGFEYFVGPLASSSVTYASNYTNTTSDIVLISPSSTAISLAIEGDSLFRLVPDDREQAPKIMDRIKAQGRDHVVIIFRNDTWGVELKNIALDHAGSSVRHTILHETDGSNANAVATEAASHVAQLASSYGAANVAVLLLAFDTDAVALINEITSDVEIADAFDNVWWYGADGTTGQSELVDSASVAAFLESVNFASSKFEAPPNPINLRIDAETFDDDAGFADGLYDAVFLLADTVIINDKNLETNSDSTVRSLILEVASGQHDHDYHHPDRTIGAGALGTFDLNAAGDLSTPLTYSFYGISEVSGGTYEWHLIPDTGATPRDSVCRGH